MGSSRLLSNKGTFALAAYVRNHPFRTVEHCAVVMLLCILCRDYVAKYADEWATVPYSYNGSIQQQHPTRAASANKLTTVQQLSTRDLVAMAQLHPASEKLLEPSKDVEKGPPPSLKQSAGPPGQISAVSDARGAIYKVQMPEGTVGGLLYSAKGSLRGGHLHNCTEFVTVLSGSMRVVTKDIEDGTETKVDYSAHETVIIPARVPHYFEALTNVNLMEWADGPKEDWYYLPYRELVTGTKTAEPRALHSRRILSGNK